MAFVRLCNDSGYLYSYSTIRSSYILLSRIAFTIPSPTPRLCNSNSSYSNRVAMASARAEGPAWKLRRAIASPYSPLRGALLILNVLLYTICPVSAVAALPRDHFRGPPYSNSTTDSLPRWHNGSMANASLSTWGSTFASGSRLATRFSVDTTQGRPYTSPSRGLRFASHSPHNITNLPWSANATHRQGSTTSMSSSPSGYLKMGDHSPHNITNLPWSANATHRQGSTTSMSSSPSGYLKMGHQEPTTIHRSTDIASLSTTLSSTPKIAHQQSNSSHDSASGTSSVSRKPTRAHGGITLKDVSLAKTSSISSSSPSSPLPSSSSRSESSMTQHHTSNFPNLSRPSSTSSKTLPPARSSTRPSQSSLASITPKSSRTPTPSVTSAPSSSSNTLPFSLPPGCKIATLGNQTYVLIPTERARRAHQNSTSSSSLSPSATAQAGAAGYNHGGNNLGKPESFDNTVINHSPSTRTASIALGVTLGLFPTFLSVPILWYEFRKWRLEKYGGKNGPQNPAEETSSMYDIVKKGKWTETLARWFKDFDEFTNDNPDKLKTVDPPKKVAKLKALEVSLHSWKLL